MKIPDDVFFDDYLSSNAIRVYGLLQADPNILPATLACSLPLTESQVTRAIRELKTRGLYHVEKDGVSLSKVPSEVVPREKREPKLKTIPEDIQLSEEMRGYARSKGMTDIDVEFEKFRLYHESKRTKYADWTKVWQTWCLNHQRWKLDRKSAKSFVELAKRWTPS